MGLDLAGQDARQPLMEIRIIVMSQHCVQNAQKEPKRSS